MLSNQIDTKSLELVIYTISSTTSNYPSLQAIWNQVFHYVRLIDAARLLDTLEYISERFSIQIVDMSVRTCCLFRMDPRPKTAILVMVSSCSRFIELPFGPSSFPTKLN